MTVEECLNVIAKHAVGRMVVQGEGDGPHPKVPPAIRAALQALVLTESERIDTILAQLFLKAVEQEDACAAVWLQECRERILNTSPGSSPVCDAVESIRRTESERAAGVVAKERDKARRCADHTIAGYLDKCYHEILATSPGKDIEDNAQQTSETTSPGERWEMEPYGQQHAFYDWLASKLWPGIDMDEIRQRLCVALYSESVRCSNILLAKSHQMGIGEMARNVLKECRGKMLGTLPGKEGG